MKYGHWYSTGMRYGTLLIGILFALTLVQANVSTAQESVIYEDDWESLSEHTTPQWFRDAKFGIFIHWGVYSVPAFCDTSTYSEWYQYWCDTNAHGGLERRFHEENYGVDFEYHQFAPMFKAEMWNPAKWAELFRRSGARYMVITSKHHDGFCLWPSKVASEVRGYPWNSVETGPGRDLTAELFEACRAEGVRPGLYYSFMEWHNPLYEADKPRYVEEVMFPQVKELIQRYEPEVFWPDGEWDHPDTLWRSPELLAWIYNNASNSEELAVNDRWGRGLRGQVGDYSTTEYGSLGNSSGEGMRPDRPFEECRGIGHSFAFNRAEDYDIYSTRTECIRELIDLVSKGGCLLLDIGPTADGRIPVIMQDRLLAIGRWLEVNGEAIYGTDASPFAATPWGRATCRDDAIYLHVYEWPADDMLHVPGLLSPIRSARVLGGSGSDLEVSGAPGSWTIDLDPEHPAAHATVIRLDIEGAPRIDRSIRPDRDGLIMLTPDSARIKGVDMRVETRDGHRNLGWWSNVDDLASWTVTIPAGRYNIMIEEAIAPGSEGSKIDVKIPGGGSLRHAITESTGSWDQYRLVTLGEFELDSETTGDLVITCSYKHGDAVMNIRSIRIEPING